MARKINLGDNKKKKPADINDVLADAVELGWKVFERGPLIEMFKLNEEELKIIEDLKKDGWDVFIEQKAYMRETFAYKFENGERKLTPAIINDVDRVPLLEQLKQVKECI